MRRESRVLRRSLRAGKVYRETARKLSEIGEQFDFMGRSHATGGQPRSDPRELEEPEGEGAAVEAEPLDTKG
jgi:hypothetical protein